MDGDSWTRFHAASTMWRHAFDFRYIDTPYWVSQSAIEMTFPHEVEPEKNRFRVEGTDQYLVASGEQGFAQLMLDGVLPEGKYQTIGPCFRDDAVDRLHQKHFMKLELIDTTLFPTALHDMVDGAVVVLRRCGACDPIVKATDFGFDIEINGIEVGSYGIREARGFKWVFGTGLAEPRFSLAIT